MRPRDIHERNTAQEERNPAEGSLGLVLGAEMTTGNTKGIKRKPGLMEWNKL